MPALPEILWRPNALKIHKSLYVIFSLKISLMETCINDVTRISTISGGVSSSSVMQTLKNLWICAHYNLCVFIKVIEWHWQETTLPSHGLCRLRRLSLSHCVSAAQKVPPKCGPGTRRRAARTSIRPQKRWVSAIKMGLKSEAYLLNCSIGSNFQNV